MVRDVPPPLDKILLVDSLVPLDAPQSDCSSSRIVPHSSHSSHGNFRLHNAKEVEPLLA